MSPRLVMAALAIVLSAGPRPAPAVARAPLVLGVEDDPVFQRYSAGLLATPVALDRGAEFGASLLKLRAIWARIETSPGRYDLTALAPAVAAAKARGWRVLVMLSGPAPQWATADRRVSGVAPDATQFAAFARAVASRVPAIDQFSIWNEPNWPRSLAPRARAAALYRRLFVAGARRLRSVAPHAEVLIGELAPLGRPYEPAISPLRFLRHVVCRDRDLRATRRCTPLVADGLALHPYTLRWAPTFGGGRFDATMGSLGHAARVLTRLARMGALRTPSGAPLPLDLTEWGFHARPRVYPAERNPAYARHALHLACVQPRVRSLIWYQVQGNRRGVARWDTGLLNADGSPRPVFDTLTRTAREICPLADPVSP